MLNEGSMGMFRRSCNAGAFIIRIGFWGIQLLYYNCDKEPQNIVLVIISAPRLGFHLRF